jgi:hypothetical protein
MPSRQRRRDCSPAHDVPPCETFGERKLPAASLASGGTPSPGCACYPPHRAPGITPVCRAVIYQRQHTGQARVDPPGPRIADRPSYAQRRPQSARPRKPAGSAARELPGISLSDEHWLGRELPRGSGEAGGDNVCRVPGPGCRGRGRTSWWCGACSARHGRQCRPPGLAPYRRLFRGRCPECQSRCVMRKTRRAG